MQLFNSIFSTSNNHITLTQMSLIFGVSLAMGVLHAAVYKYKSNYTKEFVISLSLMPALIAVIIALVNGNLGAGVAVAGTFSLIKFRSAAGSSKEMLAILLAMAIGLATGMGFLGLAVFMTLVLSACILIFENIGFAQVNQNRRHLLVTVPIEFDYDQFFENQFGSSCKQADLISLKYKQKKEALVLEYQVLLEKSVTDKKLVDTILTAGPLDVILNKQMPKKKYL
ncbi:DUF4956 domain-containing protein [Streptococcus iners]|uniref:DUF4956 domain-containing protein n=2 Tax=Streptococcus iners TaxID=3028084 RepID=A0AA96W1L9_9STRE|nr:MULTISPECIES: DUF4956 domain-containing protein [unclassified Streptococcus]MCK4025091.1 DUF4956 domain-containing protein [Streptococcus suis]MCK4029716.1 DUF4956 domain-containing protein [Streptococcus suis]WNY48455.1 DUF4956 domain-containing protein [Streptococcus sp. 29892]WNY51855.1 DUF4956 domain-containing protein [Streptococcus sp. 29887]